LGGPGGGGKPQDADALVCIRGREGGSGQAPRPAGVAEDAGGAGVGAAGGQQGNPGWAERRGGEAAQPAAAARGGGGEGPAGSQFGPAGPAGAGQPGLAAGEQVAGARGGGPGVGGLRRW